MPFPLKQVVDDRLKWLGWFVMGALHEHNKQMGGVMFSSKAKFENFYNDTLYKVVRYLKGEQCVDGTFHDFQAELALHASRLFNPTPHGYVAYGNLDYPEPPTGPNIRLGIEDEKQARHLMKECNVRVVPVIVGKPIN